MAFKLPDLSHIVRRKKNSQFGTEEIFRLKDVKNKEYVAHGAFGTVFAGEYENNGEMQKVVVKKLEGYSDDDRKAFKKEALILRTLKHDNVVTFKAFCDDPMAIMLEHMSFSFKPFGIDKIVHSLQEFLKYVDQTTSFVSFEHFSLKIVKDISRGLEFLHSKGISHRDLKPGNILTSNSHYHEKSLSSSNQKAAFSSNPIICKLTDFGESRSDIIQTQTMVKSKTTRLDRGTPVFMAPELHLSDGSQSASNNELMQADIWSFGMTIFSILNPDLTAPYSVEIKKSSKQWTDVIRDMLLSHQKPSHGEKYSALRCTTWKKLQELYELCTNFDPKQRPTAIQIRELLLESDPGTGDEEVICIDEEYTFSAAAPSRCVQTQRKESNSKVCSSRKRVASTEIVSEEDCQMSPAKVSRSISPKLTLKFNSKDNCSHPDQNDIEEDKLITVAKPDESRSSKAESSFKLSPSTPFSTEDILKMLVLGQQGCATRVDEPPTPAMEDGIPQSCAFKVKRSKLQDTIDASNAGTWFLKGTTSNLYQAEIKSSTLEGISWVQMKDGVPQASFRNGRQYICKPVEASSVYVVKKRYAQNRNNSNFRRMVFEVKHYSSNEWEDDAIVHYYWSGPEMPLILAPHGNAKKISRPYIKTQGSVMSVMKGELESYKYNEVYANAFQKAGGINSCDASREPRDKQQLYNINRHKGGMRSLVQNDWLSEVIFQQQQQASDGIEFVRKVQLGHSGPMSFNASDQQLVDVERFCTLPKGSTILSVDTTYNLGEFYVTNTAFKNLSLKSNKTGDHPVFLGPSVVHFRRNEEAFFFLGAEMKYCRPNLQNVSYIGTDEEVNIFKGIANGLGGKPSNILCTNHVRDNIKRKLQEFGFPGKSSTEIIRDIFGHNQAGTFYKGLIDCESEYEFGEKVTLLIEKWNKIETETTRNNPPKFSNYFMQKKAESILGKMIKPVREQAGLGCPPTFYTQNSVECINFLCKQAANWKRNKWVTFNEKQSNLVQRQYDEARKAVYGAGEYCLSEEFRHFAVQPNVWRCMTEKQRSCHMNKFFNFKIKCGFDEINKNELKDSLGHQSDGKLKKRKISIQPAEIDEHVPVSAQMLHSVWEAAEKLLNAKNAITSSPGNMEHARMVVRSTCHMGKGSQVKGAKKGSPVVFVIYENNSMFCECEFFASTKLCSHAVAVAEIIGKLPEYIQWVAKNKKSPNLAVLYKNKIPQNAGKKPNQKVRKPKGKPNENKIVSTGERTPLPIFTEIFHNENPFQVQFLVPKKTRICPSCGVEFPSKFLASPFDICLVHKERYMYPNSQGKWVPTVTMTRDVYYHIDQKCLLKRHSYFTKSLVKVSEDVKSRLNDGHKALLKDQIDFEV